jgi:outer membrane protein insertion porin family
MRARQVVAIVSTAAGLAAAPARAQTPQAPQAIEPLVGRPVASVSLEVEGQPETSPALLSLIDVQAGQPLDPEAVRSTIQHLYATGRYDDVVVTGRETPAGLEVVFDLRPRHPIDRLQVVNDPGIDLEKLVKDRYGGVPTGVQPDAVATVAKGLLADAGFLTATVEASTVQRHNPDRSTLVLKVDAGPQAVINQVKVENGSPLSDATIIDRTGTKSGSPYRRRAITAALAALRDDLRARQYYAAIATFEPHESADHRSVDLTLIVDAGPRVDVRLAGDPPPAGNLADYVPIAREGAVDDDLLEDSRLRLETALKNEGYRDAHVSWAKKTAPGQLVVTFTIQRGPRYLVDHLDVPDDLHIPRATIEHLIGLSPGDPLNQSRLTDGLRRLQAEYRVRGFYAQSATPRVEAVARPGAASGDVWAVVHLDINEGPQGVVSAVTFQRATTQVPEDDLLGVMRLRQGQPYVAGLIPGDENRLLEFYLNRGYRSAAVSITPAFSNDGRDVSLTVRVHEGVQVIVDDITVVGNVHVSDQAIRDKLTLHDGEAFGEAAQLQSEMNLRNMGVFRRVDITEMQRLPGETRAHVIVTVAELPATSLSYGFGLEAGNRPRAAVGGGLEDYLMLAPRGFFEIGRRNLLGANRDVDLFSRLSLLPRSAPDDPTRDGRGFGFSAYRVALTFNQRGVLAPTTDVLFGVSSEQGVQTDFNYLRRRVNAEILDRLTRRVSVTAQYALDATRLFDQRIPTAELLPIDRLFPQVRLSTVSSGVLWDRRDDPVNPTRGTLMSADVEFAFRGIGSQVGYAKTFLQASGFRPLTASRRVVFAGRVELGLARGFARTVQTVDATTGQPITETVADLPASERFFAGGSTTVRGFQLDRLGVPEIINADGLSLGGNGLVIFNAELRTVVGQLFHRDFGIALFSDSGNVFARAGDIDLARLRGSLGFGLRYDSPFGPLRLDFGFKTSRLIIGGQRERAWEYHLSFGEIF